VQSTQKSKPEYDVIKEGPVMVPMRDGVRLATDLYFPFRNGKRVPKPIPAIMERTPYDRDAGSRSETAEYFASRGYVVAFQDTRGRFGSEGKFVKYLNEPEDGFDAVEWLAAQSWSNGKIGTFGISYGAHTQAALATLNPPHLSCMFLDCGGFTNAYDNAVRNSGAFELRQLGWAFRNAKTSQAAHENPAIKAALEAEDLKAWFARLPWKPGHSPLRWAPEYEDYIFEMWTHSDLSDYWKQRGIYNALYFDTYADVPQMHMGSWYDPYTRTTIDNYAGLTPLKKGPIHLLMGPWTHGAHDMSYAGDVDFGPQSVVKENLAEDYLALRLRWFDHWLKEIDNGIDREAPVKFFVMGGGNGHKTEEGRLNHGGYWREENAWPPTSAQEINFHFHADGTLSTEKPQPDIEPSRYVFDPKNPVPTVGGNITSVAEIMLGGAFDQREDPRSYGCEAPYLPLAARHDVLIFQTDPLKEALEVTGPVTVNLWASSSTVDTDFTAKLVDVYPPNEDYPQGFDMNITDGMIRARYRNSFETPELMTPGEVYSFSITLYPTSNLFAKGHRIRVDISSSNFPRLDVNPNTGDPLGLNWRIAENAIFHDATHPSHLVLSAIPAM